MACRTFRSSSSRCPCIRWMAAALFIFLLFFLTSCAAWTTRVNQVYEGDTINVSRRGFQSDILFFGIDCPEKDQPFGAQARAFVEKTLQNKTVDVIMAKQVRRNRPMGYVYVDGELLNEILIKKGLAWVDDEYCRKGLCEKWRRMEKEARQSGIGLWSQPDPVPPWQWRQKK